MFWRMALRSTAWLVLSAFAPGVLAGCGKSASDGDGGDGASATGGALAGSTGTVPSGGVGGRSGGAGGAGGGSGGASGVGGAATCPPSGERGGNGSGGEAGSEPACGMVLFTTPHDPPECQAWMDQNCCDRLEACAASAPCKAVVDCINACSPMSRSCIGCCTYGLTELPPELDVIASCGKAGNLLPDSCEWPRTSEL